MFRSLFSRVREQLHPKPTWRESLEALAWQESIATVTSMASQQTHFFDDAQSLRAYSLGQAPSEGLVCEFGVFQGKSLTFLANHMASLGDPRNIYGFDTFSGFTEEWTGVEHRYSLGHFQTSIPGHLPDNCHLIVGPIEKTFSGFVSENSSQGFSFLHIDTDTYSPCLEVLKHSKPHLKPGAVVVFDELLGYPNWRSHEWAALNRVFDRHEWEVIAVATSSRYARLIKVAIRVVK